MPKRKTEKLVIETNDKAASTIAALEQLKMTEGWKVVCQVIDGNIEALEAQILDRKDAATGRVLTEAEVDQLRDKRGYLLEVRETPDKYILHLRRTDDPGESFDPYAKTPAETILARR